MRKDDLDQLNAARDAREAVALLVPLSGTEGTLVRRADLANHPLREELSALFATGKSKRLEGLAADGGDLFVRIYRPSPRLCIVGAVHVTQFLAPMAESCGFDVTIIDPREAFATPERFGDHRLIADWPDAERMDLDAETAVATLTHDPKIDDPALLAALAADCFYIGALGSRKTHAKRVDRLTAGGLTEADLARIHAPIGLPIGAASPAEIAVSVLAEIVSALRKGGRAVPTPAQATAA